MTQITLTLLDHEAVIARGLAGFIEVGTALQAIKDNELWKERGYASFDDYCRKRWNWKSGEKRGNQLIKAATAVGLLPAGTRVPSNEGQVRPLTSLSPALAAAVWNDVTVNGDEPTKKQVEDAARRQQVYASIYAPIILRMNTGKLTSEEALTLVNALDGCEPRVRGDILQLEVFDRAVMHDLNRLFGLWKSGRGETYGLILKAKGLHFEDGTRIAASEMTAVDLRRYLDERRATHIAVSSSAAPTASAVSIVVYVGDAKATFKELKKVLTAKDMRALKKEFEKARQ